MTESLTITFIPGKSRPLSERNQWHLNIAARVRASLEKQEVIAAPEQSERIYRMAMEPISSSDEWEVIWRVYPAMTTLDPDSGKPRIYLSPAFADFKPVTQMVALIEEAIHLHQLRQSPISIYSPLQVVLDEISANGRLLKIREYLRLSRRDIREIRQRKAEYHQELVKMVGEEGANSIVQ